MLAFFASAAMPVTRPLTGPPPATWPLLMGAGPIAVNAGVVSQTDSPLEKAEVSPPLLVSVAVMSGSVPVTAVVVV